MGEDLVGEELGRRGSAEADDYQEGNYRRANRFLGAPSDVSLIVNTGQGSLGERGAGWMFARYLRDQAGNDEVLAELTQTTRLGIANVESVTGSNWEGLFSDWHAAIAVEQQLFENGLFAVDRELEYPGIDLAEAFTQSVGSYSVRPTLITQGDFSAAGRLWLSSGAHFLLGSGEGGLALSLAGAEGGVPAAQAALRLKLVRLF